MRLVKTTEKLYKARVKRAGSRHDLGEVGEVAAGCSWQWPSRASHRWQRTGLAFALGIMATPDRFLAQNGVTWGEGA